MHTRSRVRTVICAAAFGVPAVASVLVLSSVSGSHALLTAAERSSIKHASSALLSGPAGRWVPLTAPSIPNSHNMYYISDLSIGSSSSVWAVTSAHVIRFDGAEWSVEPLTPTGQASLSAIAMTSSTEGWAADDGGSFYRRSAGRWSAVPSPITTGVSALFAVGPSDVWAVGGAGSIAHFDGTDWRAVASPAANDLSDIEMRTPTDGWAVGDVGTILHFDGTDWTPMTSPTSERLNGVSAVAANDVWAVGPSATILHFDGTSWSSEASPTDRVLSDIAMVSPTEGWAVGYDLLFFEAGSWTVVQTEVPGCDSGQGFINRVEMRSANDGWIGGLCGGIARYRVTAADILEREGGLVVTRALLPFVQRGSRTH